VLVLLLVLLY